MILWLASYPKSGNTLLRSFLSTYFFSKDGSFNFDLLRNIKQYPNNKLFLELGVDISNRHEIAKNHLNAQKLINQNKNNFQFWKTHSSFVKMDYVGRFENLLESIEYISTRLKIPIALAKSNSTNRTQYQDYYTLETRQIVGRIYEEDISSYGYDFE